MNLAKQYKQNSPSLFNAFFDDAFARDLFFNDKGRPRAASAKRPAANVSESEAAFEIELALPGFNKQDLKIELDKNRLTLSAEPKKEEKENTKNYAFREFNSSSFSRQFVLPRSIDTDHIEAKYDNGILFVTLPKKKEAIDPVKQIRVN